MELEKVLMFLIDQAGNCVEAARLKMKPLSTLALVHQAIRIMKEAVTIVLAAK